MLFSTRSNCLLLNDREQHNGEDTNCLLCKQENEIISRLIIPCQANGAQMMHSVHLQKPHKENEEEVIRRFLFYEDDIEEKNCTEYGRKDKKT